MGLFGTPEPTKRYPTGQLIRKLLFWGLGRVLKGFWVWLIQIFINLVTKKTPFLSSSGSEAPLFSPDWPQRPQNNEWPNQEAQLVPFEMLRGFKKPIIGLLVGPISQSRPKMTNLDLFKKFVDTYYLSKKMTPKIWYKLQSKWMHVNKKLMCLKCRVDLFWWGTRWLLFFIFLVAPCI